MNIQAMGRLGLGVVLAMAMGSTVSLSGCGCGGDKSAIVGKWVPEEGPDFDRANLVFSKDGTVTFESIPAKWKVDNKRLIITFKEGGTEASMTIPYEISENKLVLIKDDGRRLTYLKK